MDGDAFGSSVGPWTIEQAVLNTLSAPPATGLTESRLIYYLADQERQLGLTPQTLPVPPGPSSYQGGVDADTLMAEWFPMVHVNVRPVGDPVKMDLRHYSQGWAVTVTCTHGDDDETVARMTAMCYGTAVALLIAECGGLGIDATNTVITQNPVAKLLDPVNRRQVCRTTVMFKTLTAVALTTYGPSTWADDPYTAPSALPDVKTVNVTVNATT